MCLEIVGEKNLPRVLVIGRETGGVSALGNATILGDLLQGVNPLAIGAQRVFVHSLVRIDRGESERGETYT